MLNFNSTGVMILGSILFIVRYLALWYYRVIDPALA
jgi:chromate transporter